MTIEARQTNGQKNQDKWYILPSSAEENESTSDERHQLKPIHKYFYTLILFFSYFSIV